MPTEQTGIQEAAQDFTNEQQAHGASCNIYWVAPDKVFEYWQLGYEYIDEAMLDYSLAGHSMADILKALLEERMQLWCVSRKGDVLGVVVTQIYELPVGKVCNILLVGGKEFERWRTGAMKALREFATHLKCDIFIAIGRPGWKKWAKKCGFELKFVTYVSELGEENDK